jgi:hypothetical protein
MNQLEEWRRNEVIRIYIPGEAYGEVLAVGAPRFFDKAKSYIRPIITQFIQETHGLDLVDIEHIIFPEGANNTKKKNDVRIVFISYHSYAILITNDGGSRRQPNGILGSRAKLAEIGIQVMRDSEAVELVKEKIQERDIMAREIAKRIGQPVPEWVGID